MLDHPSSSPPPLLTDVALHGHDGDQHGVVPVLLRHRDADVMEHLHLLQSLLVGPPGVRLRLHLERHLDWQGALQVGRREEGYTSALWTAISEGEGGRVPIGYTQ